jgi:DNA-directed RNA polymerase subunit H (RpoH/RPB5)
MDPEVLRKYSLSYENMLKTVKYRGYEFGTYQLLSEVNTEQCGTLLPAGESLLTKEEFNSKYVKFESTDDIKEDIGDSVFENTKNEKLLLRWVKDKKFGASIRDVSNTMRENNITRALIVADDGINPTSKETLKNLKVCYGLIIDVWSLQESMIFPPEHVYTPKHRICTVKEKKELYRTYGLKDRDLPRIKPDDVMVKYLGATRKQVIQITRRSDTNPQLYILYYRIVL